MADKTIKLKILDKKGKAVKEADVWISWSGGVGETKPTNSDGIVELDALNQNINYVSVKVDGHEKAETNIRWDGKHYVVQLEE